MMAGMNPRACKNTHHYMQTSRENIICQVAEMSGKLTMRIACVCCDKVGHEILCILLIMKIIVFIY